MTRDEMIETPVTLDGLPARVTGRKLDHAVVAQIRGPLALEWAWSTVERVILAGGKFES